MMAPPLLPVSLPRTERSRLGAGWGRQKATSTLAEAGFTDVAVHEVETEPFNLYYVARKS